MNKTIKVSFPEILGACLNKTKTSTLRKAYEKVNPFEDDDVTNHIRDIFHKPKPCKYEVGKTYDLVWTGDLIEFCRIILVWVRERYKNKIKAWSFPLELKERFFRKSNKGCDSREQTELFGIPFKFFDWSEDSKSEIIVILEERYVRFDLKLAAVKVTSIEKVEISRGLGITGTNKTMYELMASEGFKDVNTMFKVIEKYADGLETAKPFWLIKFKYLED